MSKLNKSIKNARIAFFYYFVSLAVSFVSRKIFIDSLGTEIVGLSATMLNILGFLNLAELGIFAAVSHALYKPLVDKNHEELNKIISLFGYLYRYVGLFIMVGGIVVSFFLPLMFSKSSVDLFTLYASFYTFLSLTLFSYFNNYRQILLVADQKGYVVTRITNYIVIVKVLIQVLYLLYLDGNYIGWLIIELVFGLGTRSWTNYKVKKEYPWLQPQINNGKSLFPQYKHIIKNVKNLFAHKMAEFVLFQTDQILIYAFTSLSMVTYFTNYTMVIKRLAKIVISTISSNLAAVGHIVAEGDVNKSKRVFTEFNSMFFFIAGVLVYCLYYLTEPFISLWLGTEFILPTAIFILMLADTYILLIRQTVMFFINGFGIYKDVWAAWTEASINIVLSVVLGYYFGLLGIVIGTVVSTFVIVCLWKPFYLFSSGFKMSVWSYWKEVFIYIALFAISAFIVYPLHQFLKEPSDYKIFSFNSFIILIVFAFVYGVCMYFLSPGLKGVVTRFTVRFRKRNEK